MTGHCDQCDMNFTTLTELYRHRNMKHNDVSNINEDSNPSIQTELIGNSIHDENNDELIKNIHRDIPVHNVLNKKQKKETHQRDINDSSRNKYLRRKIRDLTKTFNQKSDDQKNKHDLEKVTIKNDILQYKETISRLNKELDEIKHKYEKSGNCLNIEHTLCIKDDDKINKAIFSKPNISKINDIISFIQDRSFEMMYPSYIKTVYNICLGLNLGIIPVIQVQYKYMDDTFRQIVLEISELPLTKAVQKINENQGMINKLLCNIEENLKFIVNVYNFSVNI